eukprot:1137280-Pelagomonas_calceolata.AAC.1
MSGRCQSYSLNACGFDKRPRFTENSGKAFRVHVALSMLFVLILRSSPCGGGGRPFLNTMLAVCAACAMLASGYASLC